MKAFRKLFALLMAMLMTMSLLATVAMAVPPSTIKIENAVGGHTYEAYQIFSGTLNEEGTILTEIEWGSGVNGAALLTALQNDIDFGTGAANLFSSCDDAKDVATVVSKWDVNGANARNFADAVAAKLTNVTGSSVKDANNIYTISGLAAGYYLVRDNPANPDAEGFAYTDYMLLMPSNTTVSSKGRVPTFTHVVNGNKTGAYGEAADGEVSAPIYHKLDASVPSNYDLYKQYHVHFKIDVPKGIALSLATVTDAPNGNIVKYKNISAVVEYTDSTSSFEIPLTENNTKVTHNADGSCTFVIHLPNLKQDGSRISLNSSIDVTFITSVLPEAVLGKGSNGLGNVVTATMFYSNDPNQEEPDSNALNTINFGKLSDPVSIYTYELEVNKRDSANRNLALEGAQFKLYRELGANATKWYAIANGAGWITGWTQNDDQGTTFVTTGDKGNFTVKGLDALTYHLLETKAPANYNKLNDPEKITVNAKFTGFTLNSLTCASEGNTVIATDEQLVTGHATATIHNNLGNTLPSTGGMGTTIFYIVGAALVLGAGAAFVMKKRNEA